MVLNNVFEVFVNGFFVPISWVHHLIALDVVYRVLLEKELV